METKTFENLNLKDNLVKNIYLYGYVKPSKIQIKGIEAINMMRDCLLQSQSGTGKTATYLLGILNRIDNTKKFTQGLVILPTRELAEQVYNVAQVIGKEYNIQLCTGGHKNNYKLVKSAQLVIGTIGKLTWLIEKNILILNKLNLIVLDEADELFINGFNYKLKNIFKILPSNIQTIFISATINYNINKFSKKLLNNPIKILLKKNQIAVDLISQFFIDAEDETNKFSVLLDIYNIVQSSQCIIFCNTIRKIKWLEENLKKENFPITTIHGNMTQDERKEIVKDFRDGKTRILLTSDLLARGIDIPSVKLVINYDLPINKETYMHRIGRCGRFDKKGTSISIVKSNDPQDNKIFNTMKRFYSLKIKEFDPEYINECL